jgi:TolB protein
MKRITALLWLLAFALLLLDCGGPKKLTQDEFDQLSPQERVAYLEKYVRKNKTDVESMKKLYKEYIEMGMPEKAIPVMEDIISTDPYQSDVQFEYGEMMLFRGDNMSAYRAFRDALNSPGGTVYTQSVSRYLGGKYAIQQVTSGQADEAFPVFSPDGEKIIYQTNEQGNWDVVQKVIASGETNQLVNSPADEELPCISPDGKLIVYTSNLDDRRPIDDKFKVREIYVKDLESGIVKNLTESVADDWLPRFSQDGKIIAFVSERSDLRSVPYTEKQSDIFRMENDGDFHQQLTDDESNEGGACFNVSDNRIFFHSNRNGSYDIFMMKTDGSLPVTIFGNPESNEVNPYVSPDSQYIVFFSDQGGSYDIYRSKIDGSEFERLTVSPANNTNPIYSPDGRFVTFHSDQNGNYDIFILNLESTSEPTTQELIRRLDGFIGGI